MTILFWVFLGGLSGWIASQIMRDDAGAIEDMILGVIGGFFGGLMMNSVGATGVIGFNLYSATVTVLGAILVVFLGRLMRLE